MKYEECYKMIIENFKNKIQTDDKVLRIKIFNTLLKWYKNDLEQELKMHFENQNDLGIINVIKRIESVCKENDITKLKLTYTDENFENFMNLSKQIFKIVSEFVDEKKYTFTEKDYEEMKEKLNKFDNLMSELVIEKYEYQKSECLLDLEFLKNKGNVKSFSLRTNNLIKKSETYNKQITKTDVI